MSVNVTARIRLALHIDINSGTPNYKSMSSAEQHAEKMTLLAEISKPQTLIYLGWWSALNVTVDNDYQSIEVPGTYPDETKKYLEDTFAAVAGSWATELGFAPGIGDLLPQQLCTKMPDCSHDCRHTHYVTKPTANPAIRLPWKVGPTVKGVTANVLVFVEWSTPSMQMAPMASMQAQQQPADADAAGHVHDHAVAAAAGAGVAVSPQTLSAVPTITNDAARRTSPNR